MTLRMFCSLRLPVSRIKGGKGHRCGLRETNEEDEPKGKEGSRRKQAEFQSS